MCKACEQASNLIDPIYVCLKLKSIRLKLSQFRGQKLYIYWRGEQVEIFAQELNEKMDTSEEWMLGSIEILWHCPPQAACLVCCPSYAANKHSLYLPWSTQIWRLRRGSLFTCMLWSEPAQQPVLLGSCKMKNQPGLTYSENIYLL